MGYIILTDTETGEQEIISDEVGRQKARKKLGLPHLDERGRLVTKAKMAAADEAGE